MTEDLDKRIVEHNNKVLSLWTKRETNWKVIYHEEFDLKPDALEREKWFKSGIGRLYLKEILK